MPNRLHPWVAAHIIGFCGYYIFVAFKLSGNPLEINTYPFSSWGMFSEIRDVRPYTLHKPYDESGVNWEVELNERFAFKKDFLERRLRWNFLQHRAIAADPGADQAKLDAIVSQAYDFVLQHVDGPEDIRSVKMYHAFFRVPPYPEEPILQIATQRLLGQKPPPDSKPISETAFRSR